MTQPGRAAALSLLSQCSSPSAKSLGNGEPDPTFHVGALLRSRHAQGLSPADGLGEPGGQAADAGLELNRSGDVHAARVQLLEQAFSASRKPHAILNPAIQQALTAHSGRGNYSSRLDACCAGNPGVPDLPQGCRRSLSARPDAGCHAHAWQGHRGRVYGLQ